MYSVGESFEYEINDECIQFTIIGDIIIRGKEYLVVDDEENVQRIFFYNEDAEELEYVDEEDEVEELLKCWQEEYYGTIDEVNLWEEDYSADDELIETVEDAHYEEDEYDEKDENDDDEEDSSYIDDLINDMF